MCNRWKVDRTRGVQYFLFLIVFHRFMYTWDLCHLDIINFTFYLTFDKIQYCGWLYFHGYQFSWIELKITRSWGSKFVAIIFPLFLTQKIAISRVWKIVDKTLYKNHENWYPMKIKPPTVSIWPNLCTPHEWRNYISWYTATTKEQK